MKFTFNALRYGFILILAFITMRCSTATVAGSETTNGLRVVVKSGALSGNTLPYNKVMCFASFYNPDSNTGFADTVVADSNGYFSFEKVPEQPYNIFTYSENGDSSALIQQVGISNMVKFDTTVTFRKSIIVNGLVVFNSLPVQSAKVYILGTPYLTASDANGRFKFVTIPDGIFAVRSIASPNKGVLSGTGRIEPESYSNSTLIIELK